ncbi:MAG: phosphatidate cytidylyltransferase [Chloroflexota bacterium]
MFLQRALVTFTLGPLALYLVYLGGWYYFLPVAAVLLLATIEYADLMGRLQWQTPLWILLPAVVAQWLLPAPVQTQLFGRVVWGHGLFAPALVASLLAAVCFGLYQYEYRTRPLAPADWLATSVGIVFLGWIGSHFFRLRGVEGSLAAQWTAVALTGTWVADSAAYVVGKRWGRRKLSPRLSPNKTVEGYLGGVVFGVLVAVALGSYLKMPLVPALVLGVLVSVVSPAGDLAISMLKRPAGVKDSGSFLPGHGGALDRIDSLIWSVTMAYYLALFVS